MRHRIVMPHARDERHVDVIVARQPLNLRPRQRRPRLIAQRLPHRRQPVRPARPVPRQPVVDLLRVVDWHAEADHPFAPRSEGVAVGVRRAVRPKRHEPEWVGRRHRVDVITLARRQRLAHRRQRCATRQVLQILRQRHQRLRRMQNAPVRLARVGGIRPKAEVRVEVRQQRFERRFDHGDRLQPAAPQLQRGDQPPRPHRRPAVFFVVQPRIAESPGRQRRIVRLLRQRRVKRGIHRVRPRQNADVGVLRDRVVMHPHLPLVAAAALVVGEAIVGVVGVTAGVVLVPPAHAGAEARRQPAAHVLEDHAAFRVLHFGDERQPPGRLGQPIGVIRLRRIECPPLDAQPLLDVQEGQRRQRRMRHPLAQVARVVPAAARVPLLAVVRPRAVVDVQRPAQIVAEVAGA